MLLPRCPEPTQLGGMPIEEIRRRLREEELPFANIPLLGSQGLSSYLWTDCNWKSALKERRMSWQRFQKIIKYSKQHVTNWIYKGITWDILLDRISQLF
jgi:hypothetical protein